MGGEGAGAAPAERTPISEEEVRAADRNKDTVFFPATHTFLDLSHIEASQRSFAEVARYIDFRRGHFVEASLRLASLSGLDLTGSKFAKADVRQADFTKSMLDSADFSEANLGEARLDGVSLRSANLETAKNLRLDQLVGTDLTSAKLPKDIAAFAPLARAEETIKLARPVFLALLGACLYCWIVIGQTTDVQLLTGAAGNPLPILQASVPVKWFYLAAPPVLIILNAYLQFYLHALWRDLASLPRRFTDGRAIADKVNSWVITSIAIWRGRTRRGDDPGPVVAAQAWLSSILLGWIVPLTILGFLFKAVPLRDEAITWSLFGLFIVSLTVSMAFSMLAAKTLDVFSPSAVGASLLGGLFGAALGGVYILDPHRGLDLAYAELSVKRPGWSAATPEMVVSAQLAGANLVSADARKTFLYAAILSYADLRHANLDGVDLRNADLTATNFHKAVLTNADLTGAGVNFTRFADADLSAARLRAINFSKYWDPTGSFVGTDFRGARLKGADLRGAVMPEADFTDATLKDACLHGAVIRNAKGLTQPQLDEAFGDTATQLPPGLSIKRMEACPIPQ